MNVRLSFLAFLALFGLGHAYKFLSIGDWGVGRQEQYDVADRMAIFAQSNTYDFIVSTGDNFYTLDDPPIDSTSHPYFNERWRYVYNHTSLVNLNWYISLGNHDYCDIDPDSAHGDCEWVQVQFGREEPRWKLPYLWYSIYRDTPAGRMHMVVVDTEDLNWDKNNRTLHYEWIDNELANSQGDFSIVVGHHPIYSAGRYGPDFQLIDELEHIMYQRNVQVYLAGHDHNLQHLQYLNGTGPEFVITGGGGRRLYMRDTTDQELEEVGARLVHFEYDFGFTEVEIVPGQIILRNINVDGQVVHTVNRDIRPPSTRK